VTGELLQAHDLLLLAADRWPEWSAERGLLLRQGPSLLVVRPANKAGESSSPAASAG